MVERVKEYQKFSREVLWVALAQLIPKVKGFLIFPVLAKALGAAQYGVWSQIQVTLGLFFPLVLLGTNTAMRRFLPGERGKQSIRNNFWAVIALAFLNGFLLSGLIYFLSPYIVSKLFKTEDAIFLLRVAAVLLPLTSINQVFLEFFVTFGQSKTYTFFRAATDMVTMVLIIYFLMHGQGLLMVILISIFTILVSSIIAFSIILKQIGICIPSFSGLKSYISLGFPLFMSGYAYWMISSGDRYVIGYFMDIKAVGIYSGVYTMSNLIIVISTPIYFVLLPVISKCWENKEVEMVKNYLSYSLKYFLMVGIPAVFGMTIFGKQIIGIMSTADFETGWFLIPVIAVGMLIYQTLGSAEYVLTLAKKTKVIFFLSCFGAIVNLVLNIIFVPVWGLLGAAVTTCITYIAMGLVFFKVSRRYLKFPLNFIFIVKCLLSATIMIFVVLLLDPKGVKEILLSTLAGSVIYFAILFSLKGINQKEFKLLRGLLWKKG